MSARYQPGGGGEGEQDHHRQQQRQQEEEDPTQDRDAEDPPPPSYEEAAAMPEMDPPPPPPEYEGETDEELGIEAAVAWCDRCRRRVRTRVRARPGCAAHLCCALLMAMCVSELRTKAQKTTTKYPTQLIIHTMYQTAPSAGAAATSSPSSTPPSPPSSTVARSARERWGGTRAASTAAGACSKSAEDRIRLPARDFAEHIF